jgi:hypothetical protein
LHQLILPNLRRGGMSAMGGKWTLRQTRLVFRLAGVSR